MSNQYRYWSDEEDAKLRELYPKTMSEDLSNIFNRSTNAIRQRAHQIGVKADKGYHRFKNPENIYMSLTDIERGYIAGLIDGEGSIGLIEHRTKYTATKVYSYRLPRMSAVNTNSEAIYWLKDKLGGSVRLQKHLQNPHYRDCWIWCLNSGFRIRQLLRVLLPALIIKRDRALLVLNHPTHYAPDEDYDQR